MGGLTYFFAHLGQHPLDAAFAESAPRELTEPAAPPQRVDAPVPSIPVDPTTVSEAPAAFERGDIDRPTTFPTTEPAPPPESAEPPRAAAAHLRGAARDSAQTESRSTPPRESPARVTEAFPEFTDSSRSQMPMRAADGPRIDSLFERAAPSAAASARDAPLLPAIEPARTTGSCEAAIARNNEEIAIGGPSAPPDVSRESYASILQNGSYLAACRIPDRTVFEICAAVKDGRAVGITVVSNPADAGVNACVRSAVARLKFPNSPRLDVTHTRFDAAQR